MRVIYNDKILKYLSWFMRIGGITIYPFIILRERYRYSHKFILNHEKIHYKQQQELLIIPFYILYILEWFIKLFLYGKDAYYAISFEREAISNENDKDYLNKRKRYAWVKRIMR